MKGAAMGPVFFFFFFFARIAFVKHLDLKLHGFIKGVRTMNF